MRPSYPDGCSEAVARDERDHEITAQVESQTRAFFDRMDEAETRVTDLEECIRDMLTLTGHYQYHGLLTLLKERADRCEVTT